MKSKKDRAFATLIEKIESREEKTFQGQWFNLIRFRNYQFIQGHILDPRAEHGRFRRLAALVSGISPDKIQGFWPESEGRPVDEKEESLLASYLASRHEKDVELVVPLRNVARPVEWERFDRSREFPIYLRHIYPPILSALRGIQFDRVLDAGCGTGDLIKSISEAFPHAECHGLDINPENVLAAREKGIPNVCEADAEDLDKLFPEKSVFDLLIFCGLLNRQVTDREKALSILSKSLQRLEEGGHVIITGYSSCHLTASDLEHSGMIVLRKSLPRNLFKDYSRFYLRQFYLGQKKRADVQTRTEGLLHRGARPSEIRKPRRR